MPRLKLSRRSGLIAAATAVAVGVGGWAFAEGEVPLISSEPTSTSTTAIGIEAGGGDNIAAAVNTHDGKTVVALAIKITQIDSETVDPANVAVAAASCTDCQTVAIALEGVLVVGEPTTFSPTNLALAMNTECSNCQTLAAAYQTVVQNDTRVRITGAGRQQIAQIRQELNSLRRSDLDIVTIWQRVNDAAGRFTAVLQSEVVPIGRPLESSITSTTVASAPSSTTTAPPTTEASTTSTSVPESTTTTSTTAAAP